MRRRWQVWAIYHEGPVLLSRFWLRFSAEDHAAAMREREPWLRFEVREATR